MPGHVVRFDHEPGQTKVGSAQNNVRGLNQRQVKRLHGAAFGQWNHHPDPFLKVADAVVVRVVSCLNHDQT